MKLHATLTVYVPWRKMPANGNTAAFHKLTAEALDITVTQAKNLRERGVRVCWTNKPERV